MASAEQRAAAAAAVAGTPLDPDTLVSTLLGLRVEFPSLDGAHGEELAVHA